MDKKQVYLNIETKYSVDLNTHVYVRDIGKVYCDDEVIKKKVEDICIYKGSDKEEYDYISGTEITNKILNKVNNIDINIIGGPDVLLEIKSQENSNKIFKIFKVTIIAIILFLGASMAIINFYEDVNMGATMEKIYYIFTGEKTQNPKILTIPFSLGIGLGMFTFFSRIFSFSKRRRQEPGPMEVELYLYDKDLEEYILNELKQKKK
ncbi:stage V sporulation protein AA [Keratinibaculum paraultunense]|uniref:Stage V sporulation protein AA n=1 Tax=Keratinibaculum paraultunense TaxID=1278232 RepID=A0A4R3L032_9FIRM|nr:stage V sporulation protein AA [Keratinibaculum paraultunense]QQY80503.1 stage V sporulation protein AA [Keratinibaculum paraultunense]TCS91225.1 stage V sporulation protein AA [Keratinibaculum paraultunense]